MITNKIFPDFNEESFKILPIEQAKTIPSSWYTSSEFFNFEKKAIFSATWQYVGYTDQVKEPGDYFLATVAGNSVIIIRNRENELKAFYNVCRHRAGPLVNKDGNCGTFKCRYHGWTYNLEGKLIGTPEFEGVENFNKEDFGLVPVNVDSWERLVFINLSKKPFPLREVFEGITSRIAPMNLKTKKFHKRIDYFLNCNWKIYVDNFLEGYHLPHVHDGLNNLLDYKQYITETYPYYSLQYSPFKSGENLYTESEGEAFYYQIFPNFMMNILPGRLQTNIVIPVSHNSTHVSFDFYYDNPECEITRKMIKEDLDYSHVIQEEDIDICENVQKGLESDAYDQGRLSVKRESGVYHFQNLIREFYKANEKIN